MATMKQATRAYAATAATRSHRDQEADLFARIVINLKSGREQGGVTLTRALVDNQRLWNLVIDMLRDPSNALPAQMRASIVSVGLCLLREMQKPEPDIDFLINVNENIAAGLAAKPC